MSDNVNTPSELPPIKTLTKRQRRVLGVLIEKGITTPEYYPMTPKGLAAGCNQKNNRSPLSEYSEDDVLRTIDELRELGLAAVVHTESGRTERFRHYARKRFPFTEPQLAIMTELWLRGRQTLGDLRTRASRMVAIDSLDLLRQELRGLLDTGLIQTNGPLESRGIEVDHNFYLPDEGKRLKYSDLDATEDADPGEVRSGVFRKSDFVPISTEREDSEAAQLIHELDKRLKILEQIVERVAAENVELRERARSAEEKASQLHDRLRSLRKELGST